MENFSFFVCGPDISSGALIRLRKVSNFSTLILAEPARNSIDFLI